MPDKYLTPHECNIDLLIPKMQRWIVVCSMYYCPLFATQVGYETYKKEKFGAGSCEGSRSQQLWATTT